MLSKRLYCILLSAVMLLMTPLYASVPSLPEEEEAGVDIKEIAFSHILDSYSFHITQIGDKVISVPLPVIVKSKERGWFIFSSARFHHGHASYEGFSIAEKGEAYTYKIVETLSDGTTIRPIDLSITKAVFSMILTVLLLCWFFISVARKYAKNPRKAPSGMQGLIEPVILFVLEDTIRASLGDAYKKYAPYLLTVFFFILALNIGGMIPLFPFGANVTGNVVIPMVLALLSFIIICASSTSHYWREILWPPTVPMWLKFPLPIMPLIELISLLVKPTVLMLRLFANMMAGHLIVLVFLSLIFVLGALGAVASGGVALVAVLITVFVTAIHLLIAFIQAYVFTLLSAIFINMARVKEEHHAVETVKSEQIIDN